MTEVRMWDKLQKLSFISQSPPLSDSPLFPLSPSPLLSPSILFPQIGSLAIRALETIAAPPTTSVPAAFKIFIRTIRSSDKAERGKWREGRTCQQDGCTATLYTPTPITEEVSSICSWAFLARLYPVLKYTDPIDTPFSPKTSMASIQWKNEYTEFAWFKCIIFTWIKYTHTHIIVFSCSLSNGIDMQSTFKSIRFNAFPGLGF